jgi:hypothetical protein
MKAFYRNNGVTNCGVKIRAEIIQDGSETEFIYKVGFGFDS